MRGKDYHSLLEQLTSSLDNARFSLASNAPSGASISSSSGSFTWTPSNSHKVEPIHLM